MLLIVNGRDKLQVSLGSRQARTFVKGLGLGFAMRLQVNCLVVCGVVDPHIPSHCHCCCCKLLLSVSCCCSKLLPSLLLSVTTLTS